MLRVRRPRFEPRPRRARTRPDATPAATVEMVVSLRRRLTGAGLDAGADTIVWHLEHHHQIRVSRATVYRILRRQDLVAAEPAKKPRSSYVGFQAEQPNETWQADFTHWRLADGEILTWLDDHSRYALSVTAHQPVTGPIVVTAFRNAVTELSLRVDGHMHHIALGRTLDGTRVILLINGYNPRVVNATTGEIIRTLTIDPPSATTAPDDHQADPKDPEKSNDPDPDGGPDRPRCLATSHSWSWGESNPRPSGAERPRYDHSRLRPYAGPPAGRPTVTRGWRSADRLSEPSSVFPDANGLPRRHPPLLLPGCGGSAPCAISGHDVSSLT